MNKCMAAGFVLVLLVSPAAGREVSNPDFPDGGAALELDISYLQGERLLLTTSESPVWSSHDTIRRSAGWFEQYRVGLNFSTPISARLTAELGVAFQIHEDPVIKVSYDSGLEDSYDVTGIVVESADEWMHDTEVHVKLRFHLGQRQRQRTGS